MFDSLYILEKLDELSEILKFLFFLSLFCLFMYGSALGLQYIGRNHPVWFCFGALVVGLIAA